MNNIAIQVENVSFAYEKGDVVIKDVSFSIREDSTAMIIGPNGSGKTTLLKALVGLIEPTTGRVRVYGKRPQDVRDMVGYVPQRLPFDQSFPLTVSEFFAISHKDQSENIEIIKEHLGIQGLGTHLIGTLSGGQLQRVLIARSLLGSPKILFLDEPVSGVDVGGEETFYELIKNIQKKHGVTVIMVSHEVHLVSKVADQVICLNKEMLCSGAPESTLVPEVIEQMYGTDVSIYKHHC